MRLHRVPILALASLAACGGAGGAATHDSSEEPEPVETAPQAVTVCAGNNPLKNAYFGDLHTHTSYSLDAVGLGTTVDPAGAYAYATGTSIDRKLDFLAVTDHSEFFNVDYGCTVDTASPYYSSQYCVDLRNQGSQAQAGEIGLALAQLALPNPSEPVVCQGGAGTPAQCTSEAGKAWQKEQDFAAAAYMPCTFTSLVAYEWTATTGTHNLHRNVVFGTDHVPQAPLDYINYPTTHELWAGLSAQCTTALGCSALTIPHNSNASGGQMFTVNDADVDYMTKYQTLVEIHQHKGSSECVSPTDQNDTGYDTQCSFEQLPGDAAAADKPGYVRSGLESGLSYYASHTGSAKKNPLQLGIVAATDTHNATPGNVKESTYSGHLGALDNTPTLRVEQYAGGCDPATAGCSTNNNPTFNPAGITGVWAEQNTRDRIFAALQRREVFGTSGPRIKVRLYQFTGAQNPCNDPSFPQQVVQSGGVPMGGTISSAAAGAARFVVSALKDATDLAEIDIIKASVVNGQIVEHIERIPVSGGSACVTWTDTRYVAESPGVYYARVLEQATPRWSHYDCQKLQQSNPSDWQTIAPACVPGAVDGLDVNIQERAWTSPIWNLP